MTTHPILQLGAPELRRPAIEITRFDRALGRLLDDMTDTMRAAPGVGLAANQIGRPERVCVIEVDGRHWELINPRVDHLAGTQLDHEGCLSLTGLYAPLERFETAVVRAQDRHGRRIRVVGHGLLARALQHETDHLDGHLYIDRLPSMDLLERPVERPARRSMGGDAADPEPDADA